MKKQLLLGPVLLVAITGFSQTKRPMLRTNQPSDFTNKIDPKFISSSIENEAPVKLNTKSAIGPNLINESAKETELTGVATTTINWKLLCGSMNIYGMLVSESKPLHYNDNLNAVSFIHRKSISYPSLPISNSGSIVAEISTNWGTTFDSTCIWSDGTNWARYPQGGIYNPVGNTNINNAYAVASGPVTISAGGWVGNWFASKQLGTANYNATASAAPNAMQFISNTGPYPVGFGRADFARLSFSSTDDGVVRSVGAHYAGSVDGTTFIAQNCRGAVITKGTFNAGVFTWTSDSIIPNTVIRTDNAKSLSSTARFAWNEAGTVGYGMFIGATPTATGSNVGWQPIVYKTTNSGTTWALIPGIDFNNPAMLPILKPLAPIWSSTVAGQTPTVPLFNSFEGISTVVDANNNLHIVSLILPTGSLGDTVQAQRYIFPSTYDASEYMYAHTPGQRPYLYDFIGDGASAWTYKLIDSLSSEDPGSGTADSGFPDNPWDNTGSGGVKVNIDARIQVGRTPNGQFITYSWSESDSLAFSGPIPKKWNINPNIKTRCLNVVTGSVSASELNVTRYPISLGANNPSVNSRATLHYMSPTTGAAITNSTATSYTAEIRTPFTVTNSNPYSQLTNNSTWFSVNTLKYIFSGVSGTITAVGDNSTISALNSIIYPNPTKNNATLAIDVKDNVTVTINVYSLVGALVKTTTANAIVGQNNINIDLSNLTAGIYMAKVNVGNVTSTKKLIIE